MASFYSKIRRPNGGLLGKEFLSVNKLTGGMLLIVIFVSDTFAECPNEAHLFITAPKKMEALSGSCLQIPCNFSVKDGLGLNSKRKAFGIWIKNDSSIIKYPNNMIFNSSGLTTYPMSITGKLNQKNCNTLFSNLITRYTDTYFFRVENEPFKATAYCNPLQITVKDSPPSPRIEFSGDLREKQSVTITCSAFTPCPQHPPELTWNLQDSHSQIEENTDGTFTTKIQQIIALSDTHDGNKINCSARYPVNEGKGTKTAVTEVTLNVSYAPKEALAFISPSRLVSAGSWVNLACYSRANPVSRFSWFKKSKDGPLTVSVGDIYSFSATEGGVYYCEATNDVGTQTSAEIHLTVEGGVGVVALLKTTGIILLISTLVIFECCLRLRHS